MKRVVVPILLVVVVAIEVVLALWGPMAFVHKPSLVVTLPYSYGLDLEESEAVFDYVQGAFARTRVFRVISHALIEDYYLEKEDNPDFAFTPGMSYAQYMEMAADLGLERVAVVSVYPGNETTDVSIALRNVETNTVGLRFSYKPADIDGFFAGRAADGTEFDLVDDLRQETRAVTLFDNLVFIMFGGQVLLAVLLLLRRRIDLLNQVLLVACLLLFLFAFVYAKNASMDYVQRFIANEGRISLAESTAAEQLYAMIRFGPLFLLNLLVLLWPRIRRSPGMTSAGAGSGPLIPDLTRSSGEIGDSRIAIISRQWALPLVALAAVLFALSFPSFARLNGMPYLAWVCMIPLFLTIIYSSTLRSIFYVITFGALTSLVLNYWHGTYSYISLAFTVIVSSLFYVVFAPILVLTLKRLGRWGFAAAPALWIAFDFARSAGYIGYPWGYIGVSQYSFVPLIQVADLAGVWAITFLVVFWNAGVAWTIAAGDFGWKWSLRRAGRGGADSSAEPGKPDASQAARAGVRGMLAEGRWFPAAFGALFVVAALVYGGIRLIAAGSELRSQDDGAREMRVVLVQQNTDPRKHDYRLSFETLMEQTNLALAESGSRVPDLIVWPEGGFKPDIRYWLDRPNARVSSALLVAEFMNYVDSIDTYLITGSQDHVYIDEGDGEEVKRNFNSSVLMNGDGEIAQIYHKMHLVPFTEHFPYKEEFPWLAALLDKFDTSDWKQGAERVLYEIPGARFFTPICFEDIFPGDIRQFVNAGADVIVNLSNDYWSLTPVEGMQHAVHAMFRAVENRRPMVRATCSGLTTYITPEGRMTEDYPPYYEPGYLMVDIPIVDRRTTLYTRAGNWLPWLAIIRSAAALLFVIGRDVVKLSRRLSERRRGAN